jgi:hypothetical protein
MISPIAHLHPRYRDASTGCREARANISVAYTKCSAFGQLGVVLKIIDFPKKKKGDLQKWNRHSGYSFIGAAGHFAKERMRGDPQYGCDMCSTAGAQRGENFQRD